MPAPPVGIPTHNLTILGPGPVDHSFSSTYVEFPPFFPLYEPGYATRNQRGLTNGSENIPFSPINNLVVDDTNQTVFMEIVPVSTIPTEIIAMSLEGSAVISHQIVRHTDDTMAYRTIDISGTSEIKGGISLIPSFTYQIATTYNRTGAGNKEDFMSLYINGRKQTVSVISTSTAASTIGLQTASVIITSNNYHFIGRSDFDSGNAYTNSEVYKRFLYGSCRPTSGKSGSPTNNSFMSNNSFISNWQAESIGDPHFVGFNKVKFQFNGEINKYYNLLTDQHIHINALFRQWEKGNPGDTVMQQIGVQLLSNEGIRKIEFNCDKILCDNIPIESNTYIPMVNYMAAFRVIEELDFTRYTLDQKIYGKFLHGYELETADYIFTFFVSEFKKRPPFLNIVSELKTMPRPHGIIGQTATYTKVKKKSSGKQGEGILEGTWSDYEVESLWGTKCKFNKFPCWSGNYQSHSRSGRFF